MDSWKVSFGLTRFFVGILGDNMNNTFDNGDFDAIYGDIFGLFSPNYQAELLDNYYEHGKIDQYYQLLYKIKGTGKKILRNDKTGKHIIRGG